MLYRIALIIILYFFIYDPVFIITNGIGAIKLLYPLLLLLFINKQIRSDFKYVKGTSIAFFIILFYIIFRTGIGGAPLYIYTIIVAFIEIALLPYLIVKLHQLAKEDLIRNLLIVGSIACLITLLCFIYPDINNYVRSDLLIVNQYLRDVNFRGFGISGNLSYSYGIIQGILLFLGLYYIRQYKFPLIFIPLYILSILINARVGMLIVFAGFGCLLLYHKLRINLLLISAIAVTILVSVVVFEIAELNEDSYRFASEFFLEIKDFIFSTHEATFSTSDTLLNDMVILPESASEWLFGTGHSIFGIYGRGSDVGFILQLNYGGIVYMVLLFVLLLTLFQKTIRKETIFIILFFISTIFIANIKGDFMPNSHGFRLICLLLVYLKLKNARGLIN